MRKFLYRLTVAVITFAIGVIAVFYLHQSADISRDQSSGVLHRIEIAKSSTYETAIKPKPSIRCDNEVLKQISNEIMNDQWFVDYLADNNQNSFDCSENFKIAKVDLNSDGNPEFAVQAFSNYMCGASGNCLFWIYQKTELGYEKILEADAVQQYHFRCPLGNGYCDIVTFTHDSAFDSSIAVYKFDGEKYKISECGERSYAYLDKQGRFHERKQPLITIGKCSE